MIAHQSILAAPSGTTQGAYKGQKGIRSCLRAILHASGRPAHVPLVPLRAPNRRNVALVRKSVAEKADASPEDATAPEIWKWSETTDAVSTYGVFLAVLALGNVPQIQSFSESSLYVERLGRSNRPQPTLTTRFPLAQVLFHCAGCHHDLYGRPSGPQFERACQD